MISKIQFGSCASTEMRCKSINSFGGAQGKWLSLYMVAIIMYESVRSMSFGEGGLFHRAAVADEEEGVGVGLVDMAEDGFYNPAVVVGGV